MGNSANSPSVFISYARADGGTSAKRLAKALDDYGIPAWFDNRNLDGSRDYTSAIEDAIERSSHIAVCVTRESKRGDSFVRREIQYAQLERKPIVPLRFADIAPHIHIVTLTYIDFFQDWEAGFDDFLERLKRLPDEEETATPAATDPFREHLGALNRYVVEELRRTVLDPEDVFHLRASGLSRVTKRQLPAAYRSRRPSLFEHEQPEETYFDSLEDAFEHHQGRIMLLADPGGGKTTTLLAFAREAANRRLADPRAPLPIYVPIRTWDGRSDFVAWLAWAAGLDVVPVREAVESGRALLMLDGLDELRRKGEGEDPRLAFIRSMADAPSNSVVITCRNADYEQIIGKLRGELEPVGTVRLMPLSDEQIGQYLGDDPNLWSALQADDVLRDMARNPLILALLALAYRDEGEAVRGLRDLIHGPGELRSRIFAKYLSRRYEIETARLDNVRPSFTLDELYENLGAAALDLLDRFRRIEVEIGDRWYNVSQSGEVGPVDIVELDVRSVRRRVGPEALTLLEFVQRLHILMPGRSGSVRFAHLLLRDHFAVPYCIARLRASDAVTREGAAAALGLLRDRRAIASLIQALGDESPGVRVLAIWALGEIGDASATEPLLAAIRSAPDDSSADLMLEFTLEALGKFGDSAVEPLRRVLEGDAEAIIGARLADDVSDVAEHAVNALMRVGAPAVDVLIAALGRRDFAIEHDLIEALGQIGDAAAINPLIDALQWGRQSASAAATALGEIGDARAVPALARLRDDWNEGAALDALAAIGGPEATAALLDALQDHDVARKIAAVRGLTTVGGPVALKALEQALDEADLRVRGAVVQALESHPYDKNVLLSHRPTTLELVNALRDPDPEIRSEAADQLGERADPSVAGALFDAVGDKDSSVRRRALVALSALGDTRITELLAEELTSGFNLDFPAVDEELVRALGQIHTSEAAQHLVDALDYDDKWMTREAVANSLISIGQPAVEPLLVAYVAADTGFRQVIASILRDIGAPAVNGLVALLELEVPAHDALVGIGVPAVPALLAAIRDPSPMVRTAAATALGAIGDVHAAEPLITLLRDPHHEVRAGAVSALAELGQGAVERLVSCVDDESSVIRAIAAESLGLIGDARAVNALTRALDAPEPLVRRNALIALSRIREPGVENVLRQCRDDPDVLVRIAALAALSRRGFDEPDDAARWPSDIDLIQASSHVDADLRLEAVWGLHERAVAEPPTRDAIVAALTRLLSDPDSRICHAAALALERFGQVEPLLLGLQSADENTRTACAAALVGAAESVSPKLRQLLRDEATEVRALAARILGARGDAESVLDLIALLEDEALNVRDAAAEALARMPEHAGPILEAHLNDERLGTTVADVLGRIGAPAVTPMIEALGSKHETVQRRAVTILALIGRPAIPQLLRALNPDFGETKSSVRCRIAEALARIGTSIGIGALVALLEDKNIDVRIAAVRALGDSGHSSARAALRRARPRSPRVRQAINEALAIGAPTA